MFIQSKNSKIRSEKIKGRENIPIVKNPIPIPKKTFIDILPSLFFDTTVRLRNCTEPDDNPIINDEFIEIFRKPKLQARMIARAIG